MGQFDKNLHLSGTKIQDAGNGSVYSLVGYFWWLAVKKPAQRKDGQAAIDIS